jgi:hypothetical protein
MPERREGGEAVNGGIVHPEGCRCPGCLPRQYVIKPAAPGRPPVGAYRNRPARTFRQPPQRRGSDGKGWGVVIGLALLAVFLVWPGWAWHGQTATGGYRWDGESTAAMLIWWGILAFWLIVAGLVRQANAKRAKPQPPPQIRQAPPACLHRNAVRVESALDADKTLAWWCPDCETQLGAGFRPAGPAAAASAVPHQAVPAVSGLRWQWEWWCSCGAADAGYAATEETAQARARAVTRHVRRGCQWEWRWHAA